MATIGNNYLGLIDAMKRQDASGQSVAIMELLSQTNEIIQDAIYVQCNQGMSHLTTTRTGYPTGTWRRLYQGVQPEKSTTAQVTDATGMLEAWSEVDAELVALQKDPAAFRLSEAQAFLEGMSQNFATTLFYGNKGVDPEKFHGLSPRFDVYSATVGTAGNQIIKASAGGGGDNTSVWFVVWGPNTVHLIYPDAPKIVGGLKREDIGLETKVLAAADAGGPGVFRVMRERFLWHCGLSVRDYRYVVRIANIDISDLIAGSVDLFDLFTSAYWKLKQRQIIGGQARIYANATVLEALDKASVGKGSSGHINQVMRTTTDNVQGREILSYRGIPLRQCDALLNNETAVP